MKDLEPITVIAVNYKTPDLIRRCVDSLLEHYPDVKLLLIDNGSHDRSTAYVEHVARCHTNVTCIINGENRYHGPALHQGITSSSTSFVFTLDSDCEVLKGGFLEMMLGRFDDPALYAVGKLVHMDKYGFQAGPNRRHTIRYVHPHAMLLDRRKYVTLPPFTHHGSPCLSNMEAAQQAGYSVAGFPIEAFVRHYERGTCSRFGYGLGPKTLVEKLLSKIQSLV